MTKILLSSHLQRCFWLRHQCRPEQRGSYGSDWRQCIPTTRRTRTASLHVCDGVCHQGHSTELLWQVGGQSQTKLVAGKIAHEARDGKPPALLAKGSASLNQAIKVRSGYGRVSFCERPSNSDLAARAAGSSLAKRTPFSFCVRKAHWLGSCWQAVAVARQYLQEDKADLTCQPAFRDG